MRITIFVVALILLGGLAWKVTAADHANPAAAASTLAKVDSPLTMERSLGNPNAPVTMIEYSSLTCPHCAEFEDTTFQQLKTDYIDTGKLYYISRDFPLDAPGLKAAEMARCAPVDRYFPLIELLFKSQKEWALATDPVAAITPLGKFSGLSEADIQACFANKDLENFIVAERKNGEENHKITSTPTFIFNDGAEQFSGTLPYEKFKATIDGLAAKK